MTPYPDEPGTTGTLATVPGMEFSRMIWHPTTKEVQTLYLGEEPVAKVWDRFWQAQPALVHDLSAMQGLGRRA